MSVQCSHPTNLLTKRVPCSPKDARNAQEELAWARQAMNVSKKLQQQLPSTDLSAPMRKELEATTAELEAEAVQTLR